MPNKSFFISKLNSLFITDCCLVKKYECNKNQNFNFYYSKIKLDLYYLAFKKVYLNDDFDLIALYKQIFSNTTYIDSNYQDNTDLIVKIEYIVFYNIFTLLKSLSPALLNEYKKFFIEKIANLSCYDNLNKYALTLISNFSSLFDSKDFQDLKEKIDANSQYTGSFEYDKISNYLIKNME